VGMTEAEKLAKGWLQDNGYSEVAKVEKEGEPNFVADGDKIEVKKFWGSLHFTPKQLEEFGKDVGVVVVKDGKVVDNLKFGELDSEYDIHVESGARKTIAFEEDVEERIEDWRSKQRPIPSFTEAVNRLLAERLRIPERIIGGADEEF